MYLMYVVSSYYFFRSGTQVLSILKCMAAVISFVYVAVAGDDCVSCFGASIRQCESPRHPMRAGGR